MIASKGAEKGAIAGNTREGLDVSDERCCCSWCPFKAKRYLTVKKHIQSEHEAKQNYPCPECSFIASSMMEYASHGGKHKVKQQRIPWARLQAKSSEVEKPLPHPKPTLVVKTEEVKFKNTKNKCAPQRTNLLQEPPHKKLIDMVKALSLPGSLVFKTSKLIVAASSLPNMADIREEARIAACLYITCRQTGNPQAFKEVVALVKGVKKKEVQACFKLILEAYNTGAIL